MIRSGKKSTTFQLAAIICLVLLVGNAPAQTIIGVRTGANWSRMADNAGDSEFLLGMHCGMYFHGSNPWTVQVEWQYSLQGGRFRDLATGATFDRRLHYLNSAVLLRFTPKANQDAARTISFLGGLHLGVMLLGKESGSKNITDKYDPMDLGLHLGFDYSFSYKVRGSTRFIQSARNIGNQVIQVSIGITFQETD